MLTESALHQLKIAVRSVMELCEQLPEEKIDLSPIQGMRSLRELLSHLSILMKADLLILRGASSEEMGVFYGSSEPETIAEMRAALVEGYRLLLYEFKDNSFEQLEEKVTSYWGITYSRFEWLLQILSHFCHHRGQVHILTREHIKSIDIKLFE
ncbi:DinB family protein [Fictibacillus sp. BK138]|uniref:DinB family protein n=1 Tax=Fictibacillus sp. BK138 TaxID=2512121 RepID=UPI00102A6CAE|nr:DinB family protein [Fictibacillus sp. BK138]RZT15530.1 putative damage-inducible protein DinB [Fictibacillus sp. BK138]